jgi:hypothetical protein
MAVVPSSDRNLPIRIFLSCDTATPARIATFPVVTDFLPPTGVDGNLDPASSLCRTERLTTRSRISLRDGKSSTIVFGLTLKTERLLGVDSGSALSSVVEHFLHTEGAAGSSPAARTISLKSNTLQRFSRHSQVKIITCSHNKTPNDAEIKASSFWGKFRTTRFHAEPVLPWAASLRVRLVGSQFVAYPTAL